MREFTCSKFVSRQNHRKSLSQFQAKKKPAMEGDDDEDPDGQDRTMGPSDSLIQLSLFNTQFSANKEEELLAPLPKTAPPSPATWRRSDIVTVQNWHVSGVAGQDAAIVSSSCQIQQFLTTQKVPAIQDDDFLAPTPYTAPRKWRKSETEIAGIQWMDGIGVGGCGLEVVGLGV